MITAEEVKHDLREIRYYYSRHNVFEEAEKSLGILPVVRTVQKYNCAIRQAPLRLCDIYTSLYIQGKTQECVALELGYSEQHIRRLIGELIEYLRKNFIQGGD